MRVVFYSFADTRGPFLRDPLQSMDFNFARTLSFNYPRPTRGSALPFDQDEHSDRVD